jgi:hypothetical protein
LVYREKSVGDACVTVDCVINKKKPGMSIGEFGKYCGSTWKTMDDAEKQEWQIKADKAKEDYAIELENWRATQPAK